MTEVKGEAEAKAAAKGKEQEDSSLRADCSLCSPAAHLDGRRLALTGVCVPMKTMNRMAVTKILISTFDLFSRGARGIYASLVHLFSK